MNTEVPLFYYFMFICTSFGSKISGFQRNGQNEIVWDVGQCIIDHRLTNDLSHFIMYHIDSNNIFTIWAPNETSISVQFIKPLHIVQVSWPYFILLNNILRLLKSRKYDFWIKATTYLFPKVIWRSVRQHIKIHVIFKHNQ